MSNSESQMDLHSLQQNLSTLDKISVKLLNELNSKNTMLESSMANCNKFEIAKKDLSSRK